MRRWIIVIVLGLTGLLLVGCGEPSEGDSPRSTSTPAITQTPTPLPTTSPVRQRLQSQYTSLSESQQTILATWESLLNGEQVQCGTYPSVTDPASISAEGDARYEGQAALLRRAAINTGQAVSLWQAECANARPIPNEATVREGWLAASSAGDALREAAQEWDLEATAAP
ncbi:MAG TPA: hypothetical protein PKD09_06370 [Aggregatilinea sp.]|jgi:hypothetical protein|uniref:hypothetical protein n=1 Tax=Aggregatilinea sp. TaxID=2806333 RepID=UPI002CBC4368|nr:hypothetical protein [Aggregatilinea sp.]HML21251.1 hypothetical protein [Aggregatilinea sp.]